ncbi:MAG TPA: hypothetical protein VJ809_17195 [Pirellulales bacterium]|nr:hypothetical protein [Pirellulales bacterium]
MAGWIVQGPHYGGNGYRTPPQATKADPPRPDLDALPLPPLAPGLPSTNLRALQSLLLAVVVQALADDDLDFVLSPTFIHYCVYIGLDPDVALRIKIKYLRNEIEPHRLWWQSIHGARVRSYDGVADWQAWG